MDVSEFKAIFIPYHKSLYREAYRLTGNVLDAEDLVQELYLHLWLKRNQIDEDRRNLAYLVRIMRNLHIDSARISKPELFNINDIDPLPDDDAPDVRLVKKDTDEYISRIITTLTDKERQIIRLHIEEEKDYSEIKQETGLSIGNLRVIIARAKQKIRKRFNIIDK